MLSIEQPPPTGSLFFAMESEYLWLLLSVSVFTKSLARKIILVAMDRWQVRTATLRGRY